MEELFNYLLTSEWGQYFLVLFLLCRVFITVAPVALTERIPDWLMQVISACALASSKVVDNKGNRIAKAN